MQALLLYLIFVKSQGFFPEIKYFLKKRALGLPAIDGKNEPPADDPFFCHSLRIRFLKKATRGRRHKSSAPSP